MPKILWNRKLTLSNLFLKKKNNLTITAIRNSLENFDDQKLQTMLPLILETDIFIATTLNFIKPKNRSEADTSQF